ncbi:DUF3305 domain-containing protein [Vibrio sp.]|uniref:DUF3305 domain-containing protein n=1 Tax=Vibrio sp. TaxID=678 RepID=UPI003D0FE19F
MTQSSSQQLPIEKNQSVWTVQCLLEHLEHSSGRWQTTEWRLTGFVLAPEQAGLPYLAALQLHKDERTDYRFNLSSQRPKLFLVLDTMESEEQPKLVMLTASQSVAGQYMDGDYLVLSQDMPLPVQAWMEAYIGRHGELLEIRKKKRKGAGRSSGK